jgi:dienelactone hydrolase
MARCSNTIAWGVLLGACLLALGGSCGDAEPASIAAPAPQASAPVATAAMGPTAMPPLASGPGTATPAQTSSAGSPAAGMSAASAGSPAGTGVAPPAAEPGMSAGSATGPTLPPIDDPGAAGPYTVERVETAPGLDTASLFVPSELGKNGVKHPIVVWTNGATGGISFYLPFLEHITSHGLFIVADKMSGATHDPEIAMQKAGIDWVVAENERADSPYAGKLDVSKIAIMGHSLGAIASFGNADDPRLATTVHWSGGVTGNPVGVDESWINRIKHPVAFICGGSDSAAGPSCAADFTAAPDDVPVYYGTVAGVDHLGVFGQTRGGEYGRAGVAWLRLTLAGDTSFQSWFTGDGCQFCQSPWTGMSRGF